MGGRPFACVIVKEGKILAEAPNEVAQTHDPTAHAEILAIRKGSQILKSEHFHGCDFYEEIGKPWKKRNLPMIHHPDEQGIEVYKLWKKLNP